MIDCSSYSDSSQKGKYPNQFIPINALQTSKKKKVKTCVTGESILVHVSYMPKYDTIFKLVRSNFQFGRTIQLQVHNCYSRVHVLCTKFVNLCTRNQKPPRVSCAGPITHLQIAPCWTLCVWFILSYIWFNAFGLFCEFFHLLLKFNNRPSIFILWLVNFWYTTAARAVLERLVCCYYWFFVCV